MRISVEENDPGYDVLHHTTGVHVTVDGEHKPLIVTADDQEGYIKYYAMDADGKCIFHEVNGERRRLVLKKRGKVTIEILT